MSSNVLKDIKPNNNNSNLTFCSDEVIEVKEEEEDEQTHKTTTTCNNQSTVTTSSIPPPLSLENFSNLTDISLQEDLPTNRTTVSNATTYTTVSTATTYSTTTPRETPTAKIPKQKRNSTANNKRGSGVFSFFSKLFKKGTRSREINTDNPFQSSLQRRNTICFSSTDCCGGSFCFGFEKPKSQEIKVVIVGSKKVGKSSFASQFIENRFVESYEPTIEDQFKKLIELDGDVFHFDILDTQGDLLSEPTTQEAKRKSNSSLEVNLKRNLLNSILTANKKTQIPVHFVILLMYSITDVESFEKLDIMYENLMLLALETKLNKKKNSNKQNTDTIDSFLFAPTVLLVGNKTDLDHSTISPFSVISSSYNPRSSQYGFYYGFGKDENNKVEEGTKAPPLPPIYFHKQNMARRPSIYSEFSDFQTSEHVRQVRYEEGEAFAKKIGDDCLFMEISSKNQLDVDEVFFTLVRKVRQQYIQRNNSEEHIARMSPRTPRNKEVTLTPKMSSVDTRERSVSDTRSLPKLSLPTRSKLTICSSTVSSKTNTINDII
ncbi:hypothetical protein ABK040_005759 [Willaertia magna]